MLESLSCFRARLLTKRVLSLGCEGQGFKGAGLVALEFGFRCWLRVYGGQNYAATCTLRWSSSLLFAIFMVIESYNAETRCQQGP